MCTEFYGANFGSAFTSRTFFFPIFVLLGVIFPSPHSPEEGAVRLAVDEINNNTLLLPNHTLQYDDIITALHNQHVHWDNTTQVPIELLTGGSEWISSSEYSESDLSRLLPNHRVQYVGNHTGMLAEFSSIQAGNTKCGGNPDAVYVKHSSLCHNSRLIRQI